MDMNLLNEQREEVYKYDMELNNVEESFLMQMGLDLIKKDKVALINFAVLKILEEQIKLLSDKMDGNPKEVKTKRSKNGTTNNSNG
jgi:hypothetical protein